MATFVYILCALTSSVCAALLLNSHRRTGLRLLFWSGACFVCLAIANIVLVMNLQTTVDLSVARNSATLVGLILLVYGLVWDAERNK